MKKRFFWVLLLICFLTVLRLVNFSADPPWDISSSAGIFTDESHNIHCVRNKILFGQWQMDKYNSFIYSPLWNILQYPILRVIGVGMVQLKVLGIVLSVAGMILIYKSFKEYYGYGYGILAVALSGLNYTLIMYSRLGLYENLVIFFMILTLFFWQRAIRTNMCVYYLLAGAAAFLVFFAKSLYAHFLVACFLTVIFSHTLKGGGWKVWLKRLGWSALGVLAVAGVWYLLFYRPNMRQIQVLRSSWMRLGFRYRIWQVMLRTDNSVLDRLQFMPLTLGVCWLYGLGFANRKFAKPDPVEMFIFMWAAGAIAFPSMLSYSPLRYCLPAVPPLLLLSAIYIMRLARGPGTVERGTPVWQLGAVTFLCLTGAFFHAVIPYVHQYVERLMPRFVTVARMETLSGPQTLIMSLFLAGTASLLLVLIVRRRTTFRFPVVLRTFLAVLMTVAILMVNVSLYLRWVLDPRYSVRDTSRAVGKMLKPDSLVVGQGVMPLLVETRIRYVQFPNWFEDGGTIFHDYPVTHLYLSRYAGYLKWFENHYPLVFDYSKVIATYTFAGNEYYLLEINVPPEEREAVFRIR